MKQVKLLKQTFNVRMHIRQVDQLYRNSNRNNVISRVLDKSVRPLDWNLSECTLSQMKNEMKMDGTVFPVDRTRSARVLQIFLLF